MTTDTTPTLTPEATTDTTDADTQESTTSETTTTSENVLRILDLDTGTKVVFYDSNKPLGNFQTKKIASSTKSRKHSPNLYPVDLAFQTRIAEGGEFVIHNIDPSQTYTTAGDKYRRSTMAHPNNADLFAHDVTGAFVNEPQQYTIRLWMPVANLSDTLQVLTDNGYDPSIYIEPGSYHGKASGSRLYYNAAASVITDATEEQESAHQVAQAQAIDPQIMESLHAKALEQARAELTEELVAQSQLAAATVLANSLSAAFSSIGLDLASLLSTPEVDVAQEVPDTNSDQDEESEPTDTSSPLESEEATQETAVVTEAQ